MLIRWVHVFLVDRKQRIKIGDVTSDWACINGRVPQGTKLGPLLFITMINDLEVCLPTVKYVDDATSYEVLCHPTKAEAKKGKLPPVSKLQEAADEVSKWSEVNNTKLNAKKTKELCVSFSKTIVTPPNITLNDMQIEKVTTTKLLGVTISDDLKWEVHVSEMYCKASTRLYFLRMLRHAGLDTADLLKVYLTMVRPILEYACQVWHPGLTRGQSDTLESIQRRALRTIYPGMDYTEALTISGLTSLSDRRTCLCRRLFENMQNSSHKLHHLLPMEKTNVHNLRSINKYEPKKCRTNRYKNSFVPYCLDNFQ